MPEVVIIVVPFEDKGVAHIVAGTGAGIGVCAVLLLQLWIDLFVDDYDLGFMFFPPLVACAAFASVAVFADGVDSPAKAVPLLARAQPIPRTPA